jgi:hypothetical protein
VPNPPTCSVPRCSLDSVGGVWYSFGWESQLLETGFLAIFLVPMFTLSFRPVVPSSPPPAPILWLVRIVLFKVRAILAGVGMSSCKALRAIRAWLPLSVVAWAAGARPLPLCPRSCWVLA